MGHGLINGDTVFVTQQLSAKMLDPSAAFLLTGKLSGRAVTFADDMEQLVHLLLFVLSDVCPPFLCACDRLRDIAVRVKSLVEKEKGECRSLYNLKTMLNALRDTAEYRSCPRGRQLLCQGLDE